MGNISTFIILFLIGAIPSGPIVCYALSLKDPKSYGSKNIGATNVGRQNKIAGTLTLLLDLFKGFLPLSILGLSYYWICVPVLGHCFSPFLGFQGGKGVATGLGCLFTLSPLLALASILCVLATYTLSQNVGLSSIIACIMLIAYSIIIPQPSILLCSAIILYRHQDNFSKLNYNQLWNPLF